MPQALRPSAWICTAENRRRILNIRDRILGDELQVGPEFALQSSDEDASLKVFRNSMTRRGQQSLSSKNRLALYANEVRENAAGLPPGVEREAYLKKARQAEIACGPDDLAICRNFAYAKVARQPTSLTYLTKLA